MTISPTLQQVDRTYVRHQGRRLSYFAGCDYFRLASHPQVLKAAADGVKKFGLNVAASRLTTGNHELYELLEKSLTGFFGSESATLASNGYAPNLMVAQALAKQYSHALIDERAHGCLADAAQLLDCPVIKFRHCDADHLTQILKRLGGGKPIVLTDGMFSHDGGIAPIKKYLAVLPEAGMLLLDDAHGVGTLGKTGRGTPQQARVSIKRIIQTITLSKAFGVYGGAVLGPTALRSAIVSRSRLFVGNTPLPLPLAHAAIKSVAILKTNRSLRTRLIANTAYVKSQLTKHGWHVLENPSPIIPVIPRNPAEAENLKRRLLAEGIYPPFIKYPGGPESGYFRFAISSEHTRRQLNALLRALSEK
jgi:8-amino-7-oxononanoate synthase